MTTHVAGVCEVRELALAANGASPVNTRFAEGEHQQQPRLHVEPFVQLHRRERTIISNWRCSPSHIDPNHRQFGAVVQVIGTTGRESASSWWR